MRVDWFEITWSAPKGHSGIDVVPSLKPGTSDAKLKVSTRCIWDSRGSPEAASTLLGFLCVVAVEQQL